MAKKILLADDSITIQKVVELTFSDGDYEVVATNNGNKAIQKLAEVKPDIILSDIIMPEKNGYELCEYVKSHPDFRQIPVILLTGTFEPFDPDRAEKAGCDAVITKPFESQSLIHKVEELIQQSSGAGAAPVAPPAQEVRAAEETPMGEMPQGETRAWPVPKLDLGWSSSSVTAASPSPEREAAPVEKPTTQPVPISAMPLPAATAPISRPEPPPRKEEEPEPEVTEAPAIGGSPFDEEGAFAGETGAMPGMDYQGLPPQAPAPSPSEPEYGGATKAFPKMGFEDLQRMRDEAAPPPQPEESDWAAPSEAAPTSEWAAPSEMSSMPTAEAPFGDDLLGERPAAPAGSIFESTTRAPEEKPAWPAAAPVSPPETPARAAETPSMGQGTELSEEQIERIARRVVELMSDQVIRNIAWEVIPDLAEMVVRERIRQLESEA